MLGTLELVDPNGNAVLVSPEAADVLREQGYTDPDEPTAAEPPAPSDGDAPPNPETPESQDTPPPPENEGTTDGSVKDPAAPRGNASRDAWVAYAEQVGLQVAAEDSRADIIAAVAALEQ